MKVYNAEQDGKAHSAALRASPLNVTKNMKSHLLVFAILIICSIDIQAQTEWNKELQRNQPQPGDAPVRRILNLSGIGAVVNKEGGKCVVRQVLDGSGAAAAGLKESDVITHIDSKDISSFDLVEITSLLRGDPDTKVVLTVHRIGEVNAQNYTVVRRPVKLPNKND